MKAMARLTDRLAHWREWELNPVVVKELRQAVRNWSVTGMLLLFLVVLFCTSLGVLISQSFTPYSNQLLGAQVFKTFVVILTGASTIFIPLYVGVRLAIERQENNVDLLYISTLTPGRIIRGKLYCGVYMTLLFFSACMPFMAFTNLLRGVDLPTVFFTLLVLFLLVVVAIQVAILLACLPISRPFKILVALFGIWIAFMLLAGMIQLAGEMLRAGVGAMMSGSNFWIGFSTALGIGLALFLLLHLLSVALISPVSANRALPLRIYLTVIWLLGGGLSFYWVQHARDTRVLIPWAIVTGLLLVGALLLVVSSHDELSLRVRRRIPRSKWKRALAFLFFNGAAGGIIWIVILAGMTFSATLLVLFWGLDNTLGYTSVSTDEFHGSTTLSVAVSVYILAYALTALFIHRRWLGQRPPRLAGVLALMIPGLLAVGPNLVLFFINRLTWIELERLQLGNVFNLFVVREPADRDAHLIFAAGWLLIALALTARWFVRQIRLFRPLDRTTPAPQDTGRPAQPDPQFQ
jgi:hypothetical protein